MNPDRPILQIFLSLVRFGLACMTQPLVFLISAPHILPFASNHIILDVEVVLVLWYRINLK